MDGKENIFQWVPGYLAWLNLRWEPKGVDHHMGEICFAANRLAANLSYWSAIIRDSNWRAPLVGCACLLASGNRGFLEDLCFSFHQGSMVTPQIAVALGLLHPAEAVLFLRSEVASSDAAGNPARFVSAQTVLVRLGALPEAEIRRTGWSFAEKDYASIGANVAAQHWDFWSARSHQDHR